MSAQILTDIETEDMNIEIIMEEEKHIPISKSAIDRIKMVELSNQLIFQEEAISGNKSLLNDQLKNVTEAKRLAYTLNGLAKKKQAKDREKVSHSDEIKGFPSMAYWKVKSK